jgi:uncharacterized protein YndB with AHSA1/START domain
MVDGKPVLQFQRRLNHPPEKVWRAVTEPTEMAHWFPANIETELKPGAPMRFSFNGPHTDDMDPAAKFAEGEVLEFDPPRVYAFRWFDSVLRIELVPDGEGCRLYFSQALSNAGTWGDRPATARQAPGWDSCLNVLTARLDDRPAPTMGGDWFRARSEAYIAAFGLATGEIREEPAGRRIRFERDLVLSAEAVWLFLSYGGEPEVGSAPPERFTAPGVPAGAVTAADSPRLLEYGWLTNGEQAGAVRIELGPQEPIGTRLVVTQTVPANGPTAAALAAWQAQLDWVFAGLMGELRPRPATSR